MMENIQRLSRRMRLATDAVRMDNSEAHFKNNKLSETLECTLDVLFRKKNSALIHQRDIARQAKKDFEYMLAVKHVVNKEQCKKRHQPSTSSSSRDGSTPVPSGAEKLSGAVKNISENKRKIDLSIKCPATVDQKRNQRANPIVLRVPNAWDTRSNSSAELSDVLEGDGTDSSDNETTNRGKTRKPIGKRSERLSGMTPEKKGKPMAVSESSKQDRYHSSFKPLIGEASAALTDNGSSFHRRNNHKTSKSTSSQFRYTRGPSFNSAKITKSAFLRQSVVYDPGDYTPPRYRNRTPSHARKKRSKTSLGFTPKDDPVENRAEVTMSRQCQSAGLSRRQLKQMNDIDALIEASESPLLVDTKKILLAENKRHFDDLQSKVTIFLRGIDEFKKRSACGKDPSRFFLNGF